MVNNLKIIVNCNDVLIYVRAEEAVTALYRMFSIIAFLKLKKAIFLQTAGLSSQVPPPVMLRKELPDWR